MNREKKRAAWRAYRDRDPERARAMHRDRARKAAHGLDFPLIWATMWDQQGGCCYMCGRSLAQESKVTVDHDHRCCPQRKSCIRCRRGLACNRCNMLVGLVHDDPDLLRVIAGNLEARLVDLEPDAITLF